MQKIKKNHKSQFRMISFYKGMMRSEDVSKCLTEEGTRKLITTPLEKKCPETVITVTQKTCKINFFSFDKNVLIGNF